MKPYNPVTGREYKGKQAAVLTCDNPQYAGYKQWLEVGRTVNKGEKGIRLLLPVKSKKNEDRTYFKKCTVFNIAQTSITH